MMRNTTGMQLPRRRYPQAFRPLVAALFAFITLTGCAREPRQVILASTTSTEDSGLFDALLPAFHEAHPEWVVRVVAVGSGEALGLGRRGDADVLLVHSPADELAFMSEGYGTRRLPVMENDFLAVGPPADPAGIRGVDAGTALGRIAAAAPTDASVRWVTRGDSSGTHRRELRLWSEAGIEPAGAWYVDVGQGMGEALVITSERAAYTLVDRGTWLARRSQLELEELVSGDDALINPYHVIPVTGARNADGAAAFADWIVSPAAQSLIASFRAGRGGQLFRPAMPPR